MTATLALVVTRENGLPLVDQDDHIFMLDDEVTEERATSLAAFFSDLEDFSADLIPLSAFFKINKKPWYALYGTIEDPYPLGVLVTNNRNPRGDPFKTSRLLVIRIMEFLERNEVKHLSSGGLEAKAPRKVGSEFRRILFNTFDDEIGKSLLKQEDQETVLCAAQLEDVTSFPKTLGFFVPLKQAIDILQNEISPEERQLLRNFSTHDKALSVSLSFMEALISSLDLQEKEKQNALPISIELRHRKDSQTRYKIRFYYPRKKPKGSLPAWLTLSTTNPFVVAASQVAREVDSAYREKVLSIEELGVRMSNLAFQSDFTDFESLIHYTLGPVSYSGIRGIIRLDDFFSIDEKEGKTKTKATPETKRTHSGMSFEERLTASLEKRIRKP